MQTIAYQPTSYIHTFDLVQCLLSHTQLSDMRHLPTFLVEWSYVVEDCGKCVYLRVFVCFVVVLWL